MNNIISKIYRKLCFGTDFLNEVSKQPSAKSLRTKQQVDALKLKAKLKLERKNAKRIE